MPDERRDCQSPAAFIARALAHTFPLACAAVDIFAADRPHLFRSSALMNHVALAAVCLVFSAWSIGCYAVNHRWPYDLESVLGARPHLVWLVLLHVGLQIVVATVYALTSCLVRWAASRASADDHFTDQLLYSLSAERSRDWSFDDGKFSPARAGVLASAATARDTTAVTVAVHEDYEIHTFHINPPRFVVNGVASADTAESASLYQPPQLSALPSGPALSTRRGSFEVLSRAGATQSIPAPANASLALLPASPEVLSGSLDYMSRYLDPMRLLASSSAAGDGDLDLNAASAPPSLSMDFGNESDDGGGGN